VKLTRKTDEPDVLVAYRNATQEPSWDEFCQVHLDAIRLDEFRAQLHADQGGLCVYCEVKLSSDRGAAQVEHFHPKDPAAQDCPKYGFRSDWAIHWPNLFAVCRGGEEDGDLSCDKPKGNQELCGPLLNPLEITSARYFDYAEISGAIAVAEQGTPAERARAAQTIVELRLDCERLQRQRALTLEELHGAIVAEAESLEASGLGSDDAFDEAMVIVAEALFSDPSDWPTFFTLQRWALGDAAERVLHALPFHG
jgi:uncharacterized protein (TIGR02646 family)